MNELHALTRRHFFKQAGFGIGGAALASLMQEQLFAQAARTLAPSRGAEGQAGHLPVHGRRAVAARPLRSQAGPAQVRRAGRARRDRQGRALRVHQGHAEDPRLAIRLPPARPVGSGDLRPAAAPDHDRRRHRDREVDADDAVQPRAGADLHEHRAPGDRPPEHGVVAVVRPRIRQQGPPGVRRADLGREQPRRRQVVLGLAASCPRCTRASSSAAAPTRCCSSPTRTAWTRRCGGSRSTPSRT